LTRLLGAAVRQQRMPPGTVRAAPVQEVAGASVSRLSPEQAPAWEYMTYLVVNGRDAFSDSGQNGGRAPHATPLQDVLARAGAERWELAAIDVGARFTIGSHGHEGSIYIFKRPKRISEPT
jgi:hypothetical protein